MSVSDSTSCRIAQAELRAIWKVLAVLTVALDRIGTYHYVHGEAAARSARSTFMNPTLSEACAKARRLAVAVLEQCDPTMEALVDALAEDEATMAYWDGPTS
jgi:hypothetical protein